MRTTKRKDAVGVVCGTDFSDGARRAADAAAAWARGLDRPLLLVHAVGGGTEGRLAAETRREILTQARAELRGEATRLRASGAKVRSALVDGPPDEQLVRSAAASAAELLVLGSLGARGGGAWRLGSVAERVAATATVPTLVVREPEPLAAWLRGERSLRVFVGFDATLTAEAALDWVADLRRLGPCEVTAGHASWVADERKRFGVGRRKALETPPVVARALERELRERVALVLGAQASRVVVRSGWGRADLQLVEMARESEADLVVVGGHQRRGPARLWHGSVSRGVLHDATGNVACVPLAVRRTKLPPVPAIRRVLAATDFSPSGDHAVAVACSLPRTGGTVRIVHVVHPLAVGDGEFSGALGDSERRARHLRALRARLEQRLPGSDDARDVSVEAQLLRHPEVAVGICQEAERFGADVVVVGSLGVTGLARLAIGSVARGVLARSARPVLVVRRPAI